MATSGRRPMKLKTWNRKDTKDTSKIPWYKAFFIQLKALIVVHFHPFSHQCGLSQRQEALNKERLERKWNHHLIEASSSLGVTSVDQKRALATSKHRRWWSHASSKKPNSNVGPVDLLIKDDDELVEPDEDGYFPCCSSTRIFMGVVTHTVRHWPGGTNRRQSLKSAKMHWLIAENNLEFSCREGD
jgi:hypothetical protein